MMTERELTEMVLRVMRQQLQEKDAAAVEGREDPPGSSQTAGAGIGRRCFG
jgi:hypothetical protein